MIEKINFLYSQAINPTAQLSIEPMLAFSILDKAGLAEMYPDFRGWFFGKVVPGLDAGERCILPWTINGELSGLAICKSTKLERKLCTLWVSDEARNHGVAKRLASKAFTWLGTSKPLFTVPQERIAEFGGLIKAWSFSQPVAYPDIYRTGRIEYVFNGPIEVGSH